MRRRADTIVFVPGPRTIHAAGPTTRSEYVRFVRHAIVDLTRLESIDDRGVGLLDALAHAAAVSGGSLAVHDPGVLVEHVIGFCGVSDHIVVCAPR